MDRRSDVDGSIIGSIASRKKKEKKEICEIAQVVKGKTINALGKLLDVLCGRR